LAFGSNRITFRGKASVKRAPGMTDIQLFAFVILPIAVAALGWLIVLLNERYGDDADRKRRDAR
jgi:hypothetical protein